MRAATDRPHGPSSVTASPWLPLHTGAESVASCHGRHGLRRDAGSSPLLFQLHTSVRPSLNRDRIPVQGDRARPKPDRSEAVTHIPDTEAACLQGIHAKTPGGLASGQCARVEDVQAPGGRTRTSRVNGEAGVRQWQEAQDRGWYTAESRQRAGRQPCAGPACPSRAGPSGPSRGSTPHTCRREVFPSPEDP